MKIEFFFSIYKLFYHQSRLGKYRLHYSMFAMSTFDLIFAIFLTVVMNAVKHKRKIRQSLKQTISLQGTPLVARPCCTTSTATTAASSPTPPSPPWTTSTPAARSTTGATRAPGRTSVGWIRHCERKYQLNYFACFTC